MPAAPGLDAKWYAAKPKIGDVTYDMYGKRTGVVAAKPDGPIMCPSSHPWAYRPAGNFDYCCSSQNSNTVAGENSLLQVITYLPLRGRGRVAGRCDILRCSLQCVPRGCVVLVRPCAQR